MFLFNVLVPSLTDQLVHTCVSFECLSPFSHRAIGLYLCLFNVLVSFLTLQSVPMQEVGCNHAQSVGFSTDGFATTTTMRKLRLIWVTSRMHIEIYKYPAW